MVSTKSRPNKAISLSTYENFMGLDTSRDITASENPRSQSLYVLNNGYCDWRGRIVRDAACAYRAGDFPVEHIRFFTKEEVVFVERTGAGLNFNSERGHLEESVWPIGAVPTSTVFNSRVILCARGLNSYRYDGVKYDTAPSVSLQTLKPAYVTSVQRRLAVAGVAGSDTEVHLSRVDNDQFFPDDETEDSENVLRAGKIDIRNLIGTADRITGLSVFENRRLVIFTSSRALVYVIDPDIDQWQIDNNANINVGCISHNTIVQAGTDLIFCGRAGIYSIRRSIDSGLFVYSYTLSEQIEDLYRTLYQTVENPESISAVWDQDTSQYHVFFPQAGGTLTKRLTLSLNPQAGEASPKYSCSDFLNQRCGDFMNGQLCFGTSGGIFDNLRPGEHRDNEITPDVIIEFPYLWHGDIMAQKQVAGLVMQAAGKGNMRIVGITEDGKEFGEIVMETTEVLDDNSFHNVALSRQYERQWEHIYRTARLRIEVTDGSGQFTINGVGFKIRN